jgi:transcriptional regulator with XRE-family HTH domain
MARPTDSRQRALGEAVRRIRKERGLTQDALHDVSGVHRNHLSAIERGALNPSYQTMLRVADALEVPLSKLVAMSEELDKLRP